MTFQEQPPVYSIVPKQYQPQAQPLMPESSPTPFPPYPVSTGMHMGMPMPGTSNPTMAMTTPTPTFNMRPSLITAAEEKMRRRLETIYISTEIIKKVVFDDVWFLA